MLRSLVGSEMCIRDRFNPECVEGEWVLDLERHDHRLAGQLLLLLSQEERIAWEWISLESDGEYKILTVAPEEWLEGEFPEEGELRVTLRLGTTVEATQRLLAKDAEIEKAAAKEAASFAAAAEADAARVASPENRNSRAPSPEVKRFTPKDVVMASQRQTRMTISLVGESSDENTESDDDEDNADHVEGEDTVETAIRKVLEVEEEEEELAGPTREADQNDEQDEEAVAFAMAMAERVEQDKKAFLEIGAEFFKKLVSSKKNLQFEINLLDFVRHEP
eukprot:TRINITY_DN8340_c0_g1_i4.p1 TRINITY_DN8340_c0_g1~~TRINITY_DN8340_c0_g1_i4.p1  ORF type:complete len:317 (+),score=122.07 TRINITY_DN8340_c0_g1_i4:120-953(+)